MDVQPKQERFKFSWNVGSLYTVMCIGKKLYCYTSEGEFVAENSSVNNLLVSSRL